MSYGPRLRAYRKRLGVSQAELAHALGWKTAAWVHRRERGPVELDRVTFARALAACEEIVAKRRADLDPLAALEGEA